MAIINDSPVSPNIHHSNPSMQDRPTQPAWPNLPPAVEDLESAMGGLSLSNPYRDSAAEYETEPLLHNTRIQAAAASYASTGLRMQGSNGVPYGNRAFSLGRGSGDHYNRIMIERARPLLSHGQSIWSQQRPSLEGMRGHLASAARDKCGCRFLQMMIDEGTPEEIEMILSEVKDHMHELMTHHFGNYLIENFFVASTLNEKQVDRILYSIIQDERQLRHVCINDHGTRVVQKMLLNLRTAVQVAAAVCALRRITVPLMKNVNGGYVIQQCVRLFSPACKKVILDEVARSCIDVATDRSGCSVIQKCLAHAEGEAIRLLVEEIILNAAVLAEDPFGNYVVQYLIKNEMMMPPASTLIISRLCGKYVHLSMNRHASHVVEDLLKFSDEMDAAIIVLEIMDSPEFLNVLQDPYGNYVAQRVLEYSKGYVRKRFENSILSNYGNLHSHPYGKRVLTCLKACKIRV